MEPTSVDRVCLPQSVRLHSKASDQSKPDIGKDKHLRTIWYQKQAARNKDHKREKDFQKAAEYESAKKKYWDLYRRQAEMAQELSISWKDWKDLDFFSWEKVFEELPELKCIRFTGYRNFMFPTALQGSLLSLSTLCLLSCGIEHVPDAIGDLASLQELDLSGNCITFLPESITTLQILRILNISSNNITTLPQSLGNLMALEKLNADQNELCEMPNSIKKLNVRFLLLNSNKLRCLPECIGDMPNIVGLYLNKNKLSDLPNTISRLNCIEVLHVNNNELSRLPHNIGALHETLREIRADWNQIRELPYSFLELRNLEIFSMVQNPLYLPPVHVVSKGIAEIMQYMFKSLELLRHHSRRSIIQQLQNTLEFAFNLVSNWIGDSEFGINKGIDDYKLSEEDFEELAAVFEPYYTRNKQKDLTPITYHAVVWEDFYEFFLPKLEKITFNMRERGINTIEDFSSAFRKQDVEDALQHYYDDTEKASVREKACFRYCACARSRKFWKRMECLYTTAPYSCCREALLIRTVMYSHTEAKENAMNAYMQRKIQRLIKKTRRRCNEFFCTEIGAQYFDQTANSLAPFLCRELVQYQKFIRAKEEKLERIENELRHLERNAYKNNNDTALPLLSEPHFASIKKQAARFYLPNIFQPKSTAKGASARMEALLKEKSSLTFAIEQHMSSELDRIPSRLVQVKTGSEKRLSPELIRQSSEFDVHSAASHFSIDKLRENDAEFRVIAIRSVFQSLMLEPAVITEDRIKKLLLQQLRDAYVHEKCYMAESKVTTDFQKMQIILQRWTGTQVRDTFSAWKDFAKKSVTDKAREERRVKEAELLQSVELQSSQQIWMEARKWIQHMDVYTDEYYYENVETGFTAWEPPPHWHEYNDGTALNPTT